MQRCKFSFDSEHGAFIEVVLSKAASFTFKEEEILESRKKVKMLIDTGATTTSIAPRIAQNMGLLSLGKRDMRSATGIVPVNRYMIDLELPCFSPNYLVQDLNIIDTPFPNEWIQGLLGRNFLEKFVLEIDGPGKYMNLAIPSND